MLAAVSVPVKRVRKLSEMTIQAANNVLHAVRRSHAYPSETKILRVYINLFFKKRHWILLLEKERAFLETLELHELARTIN